MSQRIEKLLARLRTGIAKSEGVFRALDRAEWEIVIYEDPYPWTIRDLLAHLLSAEEGLLQLAQDVASGGEGAPREFDHQAFNATEQKRLAHVPPERLLIDLIAARQRTLSWVTGLEEAALDRMGRHPALGEITVETFINAIYGHQLIHMRDLKQVLT
ncbi:MAG: DinB family protein [Anaerolineae bacterium]